MELLSKIQKELKAPKNQFNSFSNYKYRSCEDILEAVKPFLVDGATLVISDEVVQVGDRYYVKATATLSAGKSEFATATAYAREQEKKVNKSGAETMDHAQITGSASSYARKYSLSGLFCIDDNRDPDTQDNTAKHTTDARPAAGHHTADLDAKKKQIKELLAAKGATPKTVAEASDIVKEMTGLEFVNKNFDAIIEKLSN